MRRNSNAAVRPSEGTVPWVASVGFRSRYDAVWCGRDISEQAGCGAQWFWSALGHRSHLIVPMGLFDQCSDRLLHSWPECQAPHQSSFYNLREVGLKIGNEQVVLFLLHESRPKIHFFREQALEWNWNKMSRGQLFPAISLQGFQRQQIHIFYHTKLDSASQSTRGQELLVC